MKNKIKLVLLLMMLFPMLYFITGWDIELTSLSFLVLFGMGYGSYKFLYGTQEIIWQNKKNSVYLIMEKTEEELEKELDIAYDESQEAFENAPSGMDFEEFNDYMRPFNRKVGEISRSLRMIKVPTFSEIPEYGDVMPLEHFKDNVESGGFIDYDGFGHYVKDGKESDIEIYPSDFKYNSVRKDFDTIIWFNR